jgi:hypothetical protein
MSRSIRLAVVAAAAVALVAPAGVASGATAGAYYGGVTSQDFPVIAQIASDRKLLKRAVIALTLKCTTGDKIALHDGYQNLTIAKSGSFSKRFGPDKVTDSDGTSTTTSGSITGKLKGDRITGTWRLVAVDKTAAGITTQTCDSGKVAWSATQ